MMARFNESVNDQLRPKIVAAVYRGATLEELESIIQTYGGGESFRDNPGAVPPYPDMEPDIEGNQHPWNNTFSLYLVQYIITAGDRSINSRLLPDNIYQNRRAENYELELAGFGAPWWTFGFRLGSGTINVTVLYHTRDPNH
jgi:hypothetical protein